MSEDENVIQLRSEWDTMFAAAVEAMKTNGARHVAALPIDLDAGARLYELSMQDDPAWQERVAKLKEYKRARNAGELCPPRSITANVVRMSEWRQRKRGVML